MRIDPTHGRSGTGAIRRIAAEPSAGRDAGAEDRRGRALVALAPRHAERPAVTAAFAGARAFAPYVAQLAATALDLPETRARRRAEPARASRAYAEAAVLVAPSLVGAFARRTA